MALNYMCMILFHGYDDLLLMFFRAVSISAQRFHRQRAGCRDGVGRFFGQTLLRCSGALSLLAALSRWQKVPERIYERRQVVFDGVPDNGGPEVPVGVDREIPEIDHLAPGDFRMAVCDVGRNVVCGFADDGQIMSHRVHDVFVVLERVKIHGGKGALGFGDCFENVLDAESPVSRRHR